MTFDYAQLERRIAALEKNRGASLRFGTVTEVKGGYARVKIPDGEDVVTHFLPTLQDRVLKDQDIKMPDVGEPVAMLFRGQGFEEGVILGACYSPETPDPEQDAHFDYVKYEDGTELWYDRKKHKLIGKVKGDIELEVDKNIKAKVGENVELEVKGDVKAVVTGNVRATVQGNVDVKAQGTITMQSAINVTLKAPTITLAGLLLNTDVDGGVGTAEFRGHVTVREGGVDVPDNSVTAGNDVTANAGAVSLRGHEHTGVMPGNGTSSKPVGG